MSDLTFIFKASYEASCRTLSGASEYTPRDASECTYDNYKKAQAKMEQQTLEALFSIFDEKIQHNKNTNANPEKGRMHSILKT